jgi:hypothetical protein
MSDTTPVQDVMDRFWYHAVDPKVDTQALCIGVMARIKEVYDACCKVPDNE